MAFAFSVPFDPIALVAGRSLTFPVGVLLIGVVGLDLVGGRRGGRMPPMLQGLLAAYLAWVVFTNFWSLDPQASEATTIQLFLRVAFLAALSYALPVVPRRVVVGYVFGAAVLGGALLRFGQEELTGRITLMGADENALGLSLTVGIGLAVALVVSSKRSAMVFWLALAAVMAAGVLATGSRTGFVAMGIAAIAPVLSRLTVRRFAQVVVVGLIAVLAFQVALARGLVSDRVASFLETGEATGDTRAFIVSQFFANPDWMLAGVGPQADAEFLRRATGEFAYVHNLLLGAWVQLGIVGVTLLIVILIYAAFSGWKSSRRDWFLAAALPMTIYAATLPGQTSNVYWFVIALGTAVAASARAQSPATQHGSRAL
ncbi:O-antigen ligase family protein [Terrabacter sp. 2RAF25]|uniref:O-antigen ligase family protein n=1 Tax=Terrabacter sp. 2RAF25 TaxID=3232998 RepID=UPI003F972FBF